MKIQVFHFRDAHDTAGVLLSDLFEACAGARVQDATFHDSRHTATTRFFEQGLNVIEVAAITGHEDLRSLKWYTQLDPAELAKKLHG